MYTRVSTYQRRGSCMSPVLNRGPHGASPPAWARDGVVRGAQIYFYFYFYYFPGWWRGVCVFVSVSVCVFLVLFPCMCFLGGAGCASPSVRVRLLDLGVVVDFVAAAFRNFEGTSHNPAGETFF